MPEDPEIEELDGETRVGVQKEAVGRHSSAEWFGASAGLADGGGCGGPRRPHAFPACTGFSACYTSSACCLPQLQSLLLGASLTTGRALRAAVRHA